MLCRYLEWSNLKPQMHNDHTSDASEIVMDRDSVCLIGFTMGALETHCLFAYKYLDLPHSTMKFFLVLLVSVINAIPTAHEPKGPQESEITGSKNPKDQREKIGRRL